MAIIKPKTSRDKRIEVLKKDLKSERGEKRINLRIDGDLYYKFKKKAVEREMTMISILTKAIKEFLKNG